MICTIEQIQSIIKLNPQKDLISQGIKMSNKLMTHVHGYGLDSYINRQDYFENIDIFNERKRSATSNKDLFGRLLQREEQVFSAQGGSSIYSGLSPSQSIELNAALDNIRFGMKLRQWIRSFAIEAYRCDPMSVIYIENNENQAYPTYKTISSIYDYLPNGRSLEYICFKLTYGQAAAFGVAIPDNVKLSDNSDYYRFVDDAADYIVEAKESSFKEVNKIQSIWGSVPAFIASDIMAFDNTQKFLSPLDLVIELADTFLTDRSIRDLQKKYHGFAKAIEPLLMCGTCTGTGFLSGSACPDCTPAGASKGSGYKLKTKVADVARFPLDSLKEGFDLHKIFGYVAPDVKTWDKQDSSLGDIENLMRDVYWGTDNRQKTTGPSVGETKIEETATKTLSNLQPIYARLNKTADWAERTENIIVDFVGRFLFKEAFKKSSITYGRYYILETPAELMDEYLNMKTKGASQFSLFDALKKYYRSLYATDPLKLSIKLKLINVEPFVHYTVAQVQASNPSMVDYMMKLYFSEWLATKNDDFLLQKDEAALLADLMTYAQSKMVLPQELVTPPTVGVTETIRNTN
jgi:hypothetical protein